MNERSFGWREKGKYLRTVPASVSYLGYAHWIACTSGTRQVHTGRSTCNSSMLVIVTNYAINYQSTRSPAQALEAQRVCMLVASRRARSSMLETSG